MSNEIYFGDESRSKVKVGIDIAYQAVAPTLGAAGRNVIYRTFYSRNPVGSNDGISILKELNIADEATQMGIDLIRQSSERTNTEAGDGTTTTVILAKAMIDKGLELIKDKKINPMILRKQINEAIKKVVIEIKKRHIDISSDEDIFNIANLSVENPGLAKMVVEAVKKAGENGDVLVEESSGMEITKEEVDGLTFGKGFISPYMMNNPITMGAELTDVLVLVTDKTMNMNQDLFPLLDEVNKKGIKQLLIICENVQGELLSSIIANRMKGQFNCVVVQKPDSDTLEDIALITRAECLTSDKLTGFFTANHFFSLGKAKKVLVSKDSTLIVGGYADEDKVKDRIENLKREIKTANGYKKDALKERLAKLVGGIVTIKVGAPTEAEMKYLKMKIEDAVAATRAALEEGIVIGGGKSLYEIGDKEAHNPGEEVIYYACQQPIRQIIENAGYNPDEEIPKLKDGEVWDSLNCEVCSDPIKKGLIDPAKVERCSLENAASSAALFLTSFATIVEIPEVIQKS
jgi:chaperonin GroEL